MGEIPVWTIVMGTIAMLVNIVIGLLIWSVSQKLGDIKESIVNLTSADRDLSARLIGLDRDLSAHKLHVSETYVRLDHHQTAINAIFNTLRETKEEIISRVQELVGHLEARFKNGTNGGQ